MQELSEHKTGNEKLDDYIRNIISSAFQQVGYSEKEKMLLRDIRFVGEGGESHEADMVAYSSSLRQDADTDSQSPFLSKTCPATGSDDLF